VQNGQVEVNAFFTRQVDVQGGVNFAVVGQVYANVAGSMQIGVLQQVKGQVFRGLRLLLEGQ
jgi:hypothetical protein